MDGHDRCYQPQIKPELCSKIDAAAESERLSRSSRIRKAIEAYQETEIESKFKKRRVHAWGTWYGKANKVHR